MDKSCSSTTGERRTTNQENISESSMHSGTQSRSFRIAETYTTTNASTLRRLSETEFDLEQLDLEDFEDFDSDDCETFLDLERFDLDELDLDAIDLDALDEDERRTLTQWLKRRHDVRLLYQGRQVSQQCALQLVARNVATNNIDTDLDSANESITTDGEDSEAAESSVGDPTPENVRGPPVINGDDWMLWCE